MLNRGKVRIIRRHDSYPIPRTPKKPPASRLRPWLGWALKLSLVGLVVLAGFAVYLDAVVQEKFSGKRWTIPAKVYARPLELFVGQKLSKDDFLTELDALGYRRESVANGPVRPRSMAIPSTSTPVAFSSMKAWSRHNRCGCVFPAIMSLR